jgi:hypothetical protein
VKLSVEFARGRGIVMAGTGSNSTREAVEMTKEAEAAGAKIATTKHREFLKLEGGKDAGVIVVTNDWMSPDGKRQLEDERRITFSATADSHIIDFDIDLKATDGDVEWGDNKDGTFGLRIPSSMDVKQKEKGVAPGHIINSEGLDVPGRPPLAASKHTDVAGVSLLWQREPGLQAQSADRTWHDVPMLPNTVSVHLGTVLQLMTDGRVPATPHRVVDHGQHRQSVAFFVEPGLGTRLAPLQRHTEPDEAPDPAGPGTYGWHLQERFSQMEGYRTIIPAPE